MKHLLHILRFGMLALLLTITFPNCWAQNDDGDNEATPVDKDSPKRISGGYGYFMPGYGMQDLAPLNGFVGSDAFQGNGIMLGGGGTLIIRSLMLGGEGNSHLARKATLGNMDMTLESGFGKFTLGYVVYGRKGLLIYPKVGIGGFKETLTLHKTDVATGVDSIFAGGFTGTTMQKNGVLLSFGAGLDWMPGFDETAGSGFLLGFDVGYSMGLTEKPWEAYGASLTGGPSISPNGIFVNLHIGFAGWNRQ